MPKCVTIRRDAFKVHTEPIDPGSSCSWCWEGMRVPMSSTGSVAVFSPFSSFSGNFVDLSASTIGHSSQEAADDTIANCKNVKTASCCHQNTEDVSGTLGAPPLPPPRGTTSPTVAEFAATPRKSSRCDNVTVRVPSVPSNERSCTNTIQTR